jgi:hypothetical protein
MDGRADWDRHGLNTRPARLFDVPFRKESSIQVITGQRLT